MNNSPVVNNIKNPLYDFDSKTSIGQLVPLGLQHVVAAIVGIVTPAIILSNTVGLSEGDKTLLIQVSLVFSALSTLFQVFGLGIFGARLPVIIGVSFAYIPILTGIGKQFDLATILGAQVFGAVAAFLVGFNIKQIRKLFPPVVTGTVIFTIGLSLYPTAIKYMAGGAGSKTFGSAKNWSIALLTFLVVVILNNFTKGFTKLASILIGMVVGYVAAFIIGGMISFDGVQQSTWFQIVPPMKFGLKFEISSIITMVIMFIVNAVQAIGDLSSTTWGGMDREPTDKELSGGIMASGISNFVGAFFGAIPSATYSQNVGIVTVSKVINKYVFGFAAVVLLIAGLVPKFAAVLTTIPQSVIGGATISVFASIAMTGVRMIDSAKLTNRNVTIVGLAVAVGVGITSVPGCLDAFPVWVNTIFGSSSVVLATMIAILLNVTLPKEEA